MNDQTIIDTLTAVINPVRALHNRLANASSLTPEDRQQALSELDSLYASVKTALGEHPDFSATPFRRFDQKQLPLFDQHRTLISLAADRGPQSALAWLRKIHSVTTADIRYVAEVYGLQIGVKRSLPNGVVLMPLENLPPSPNASALIAQFETIPIVSHRPMYPPNAATLVVPNVEASSQPSPNRSTYRDTLERTIKAFTLVNEAQPVVGVLWLEFVDPDLALAEFGRMWFSPRYDGILSEGSPTQVDDSAFAEVERYLLLSDDVRTICDVAIDRLNLARRRLSPGDQAIEGAICLEALLGDNDNQELTYKLKLRSALLLETTLENRRQVRKAVDRFYKLRSRTVHGRSHQGNDDHQIAKEGLTICARVLRKIVERNEKPVPQDWELKGGA